MLFLSSFLFARRAAPNTGASFRRGTDAICGFFSFGRQGKPIWVLARQVVFLSCTQLSDIFLTMLVLLLVLAPHPRPQQHS